MLIRKEDGRCIPKVLSQKICVAGTVYEMQDVYGIDDTSADAGDEGFDEMSGDCVICMTNKRDTTVIPCRFSTCALLLYFERPSNCVCLFLFNPPGICAYVESAPKLCECRQINAPSVDSRYLHCCKSASFKRQTTMRIKTKVPV